MGYSITKKHRSTLQLSNYLKAVLSNSKSKNLILFDVGANRGQTISAMNSIIPNASIHAFEPSLNCFKSLIELFGKKQTIHLVNAAVGDKESVLNFNEYSWDSMSSLLKRTFGKAQIIKNYDVNVITLDNYCESNTIEYINLLKTDTEGYELKVLKGAEKMIKRNKVEFVFVEVFFEKHYFNQDDFGDIYKYLTDNGFRFIRFYDIDYSENEIPSRTDALFFNPGFKSSIS